MNDQFNQNTEPNNTDLPTIFSNQIQRNKITNGKRLALIRAVCDSVMTIKQAAGAHNVGYVNARKIINVFKKERRQEKKSGSSAVKVTESIVNKIKTIISENLVLILSQIKNNLVLSEPPGFTISLASIECCQKIKNSTLKGSLKTRQSKLSRENFIAKRICFIV
ncbi:hypothetical protein CDIK_2590 [Cucumispora dikerogammari]|nr:hypothetical protein CDIK_2590 [Cucumispora dikerogammari]